MKGPESAIDDFLPVLAPFTGLGPSDSSRLVESDGFGLLPKHPIADDWVDEIEIELIDETDDRLN